MRLVTWNERDNPDLPALQVQADMRKGRRMFGGSTLIGFQEIGEEADHRAIRGAFKRPFTEFFRRHAIPIVANTYHMKVDDLEYVIVHGGKAGRSPHRGYTVCRVNLRLRPRIKPFYVINTHMVSKPSSDDWGEERWGWHWAKLQKEVQTLHSQGYDVFLLGDLNRSQLPTKLHPSQQVLAHNHLDWIIYVPTASAGKGNKITRLDVNKYQSEFYTDHAVLELLVKVSKK